MFGLNKTTSKFCDLKGKVAIVTGAGKGMGRADSLKLAGAGAKVVLADISLQDCQSAVEEIKKGRGEAIAIKCDVSKKSEIDNVVAETLKKFGKIDILVNNAGIYPFEPFLTMPEQNFEKVIDINLKGYFLMAQACAKEMVKQKSGAIVNISSIAMGQVGVGFAGLTHYCASKGGITAMSQAMALELAPFGIRVNCIAPGSIDTPGTHTSTMEPKVQEAMNAAIPMKRSGKSEEIANAVLFLASDESSYMTGSTMVVDGGWVAG
ncbi:MAG: SDR family NAD(P)-dependent oxidoreductase [Candidatus Staskawiczbacteria bacterium]|nr:SDR family NAD(P)-dependent oxidoreductase [Candidatus Staskawiczbacteria bacterium]